MVASTFNRRRSSIRRRIRRGLFFGVTCALLLIVASPTAAQKLDRKLCPGNSANYSPEGVVRFTVGDPGAPLLRHTLLGPHSRCNDGSPAVMFIRPGQDSTRWVIYFQGGGSCSSEQDCYDRWCSTRPNPKVFDKAGKMSSLGAPQAIRGTGIFSQNPSNAFGLFNHVYLFYCSSDSWNGSAERGEPIDSVSGLPVSYEIEFNGEAIVNDAFETLRDGPTYADPIPLRLINQDPLPDLDEATEVILAGESAGGVGLRHHVDRLRDTLLTHNSNVKVAAVVDAAFPPLLHHPTVVWGPNTPGSYANLLLEREVVVRKFWGVEDSALDASCLDNMYAANHTNVGGLHPQICFDTSYTLVEHIITPFFIRMDLQDPLPLPRYVSNWQIFPNELVFARAIVRQLTRLPTHPRLEPYLTTPGVFGPNCREHIALMSTMFLQQAVRISGPGGPGPGTIFHDLLDNWLGGVAPTGEVQADNLGQPGYTRSWCP